MNSASDIIHDSNLLRSLQKRDIDLLLPYLEPVQLKSDMILYEPGDIVQYAYFPCGAAMVSFKVLLDDGRGVETALIGREGAVGGIVSQGHLPAYCQAIVQYPGMALRIETAALEKAKARSPILHNFFARYADCLLAQIFQAVACNATHTIEQRATKWLIAALDRTGEKTIPLTQEQLANMLGVGRSYVGRVMSNLKAKGIVESLRGKLHVHRLEELKMLSCNCDKLVRSHFDEVLGFIYPGEQ